jgi:hypothetical protein
VPVIAPMRHHRRRLAPELAHGLRQRGQIAAQIGHRFLPAGAQFLEDAQQLHIHRAQAQARLGLDMRLVDVVAASEQLDQPLLPLGDAVKGVT